ncbi:MAG: hypothetical protein AB1705_07070 [Verrucomicrobiota bacterium]
MLATNSAPVVLILGNPKAEIMHFAMMEVLFTAVAVLLFFFLTRRTSLGEDIEDLFSRKLFNVAKGKAFAVTAFGWLVASSWFYNSVLGSEFFELHCEQTGGQVAWRLVYAFPERARVIPAEDITNWTGMIKWSRRAARHALIIETKTGRKFQSVGLHPAPFREQVDKLLPYGIKLMPDQKLPGDETPGSKPQKSKEN